MRALTYRSPGEPTRVLSLANVPDPQEAVGSDVVVNVPARPVHPGDLQGIRLNPVAGATVPGLEGAGLVDSAGPESSFVPGQRVAFFPTPGRAPTCAGRREQTHGLPRWHDRSLE